MSALSIEEIIFAACRGGWLASFNVKSDKAKRFIAKDYVNVICDEDILEVDNVKRNPVLAWLILRSYARNLCMLVQKTKMLADITVKMEISTMTTFGDYVGALERLYVIEDIDAW